MANRRDFYRLLGIRRNASVEDIRQAYFKAARRYHPDKNISPGDTEYFLGIQEAYEVLANPGRRRDYDLLLPEEERPEDQVQLSLLYSRSSLARIPEPQLLYVLLSLSHPPGNNFSSCLPFNFCLVLDRSTSMQGNNLDKVKAAAAEIMHNMRPDDLLSVIAFSDQAEKIIPASRDEDLKRFASRLHMLQPSGATEIYQGLEMGYRELKKHLLKGQVNHLLLLTDGRTYGDESQCLQLARQAAEDGIGISCLGIGTEWNDNFLDELSALSGGSCMLVTSPQEIMGRLMEKFSQLGKTYADQCCLDFKLPDGMQLTNAFRIKPEPAMLMVHNPMQLGPILLDSDLKVLLEFMVPVQKRRAARVLLMEGEISTSLSPEGINLVKLPLQLERSLMEKVDAEVSPDELREAVAGWRYFRMQQQAQNDANQGNYEQASRRMEHLAAHLLSKGEHDLAKTSLLEADHLKKDKAFSSLGRKRIKYGTRSLVPPGVEPKP